MRGLTAQVNCVTWSKCYQKSHTFISPSYPLRVFIHNKIHKFKWRLLILKEKLKPSKPTNTPSKSAEYHIRNNASSFPFSSASEISAFARSVLCSIPSPFAQHLASMSMASVSPRATHSSRSATAFASFWCSSSTSLLASSLFASISPYASLFSSSSTLSAFTSFLSVICVLFSLHTFAKTEKKSVTKKDLCLFASQATQKTSECSTVCGQGGERGWVEGDRLPSAAACQHPFLQDSPTH